MSASGGGDKEVDRIFVGGLPPHANEAEVEDIFSKFGRIEQIQIRRKAAGGLPFAFVRFASPRDAEEAVRDKHGREYKGNPLRVEICEGGRMNQQQPGYDRDRDDISPPAAYRDSRRPFRGGFRGRPFRSRGGYYQRDDYYQRGPPRSDDRDRDRGGYERRGRDYDDGNDYYEDRERDRPRPPDRRSPSGAAGRRLPYERPGPGDRAPPSESSRIRTISRDRAPEVGSAAAIETDVEHAGGAPEVGLSRPTPPPAADTRRISSARERDDRLPEGVRGGRGSPSKSRSLSLSSTRSRSSSRSRSQRSRSRSGSRTRGGRERSMTPDLNAKIAASSKAVAAGAAATASLASSGGIAGGTPMSNASAPAMGGAGAKSAFSTPLFPAGTQPLRSSNVNTNMSSGQSGSAGLRLTATATLGAPAKPAALFGSPAPIVTTGSATLSNSASSANAAAGGGKPTITIAKQVGTGTIEAAIWRAHFCVGSGTVSVPAASSTGAPGTTSAMGLGNLIGLTPGLAKPAVSRADAWVSVGADDQRLRGQHRAAFKRCPSEPGPAFRELTTLDDPPPPPPPPTPPRVEADYDVDMSEDERRGRGRDRRRSRGSGVVDYDDEEDRRGRHGSRSDSRRRDREKRGFAGRRRGDRDGVKARGQRSGSRSPSPSPAPAHERRFRDDRERSERRSAEHNGEEGAAAAAAAGAPRRSADRERSYSRSRSPRSRSPASRSRSPYSDEGSRGPSRSRSRSGARSASRTPSPSAKSRSRSRGERGPGAPGERHYSPPYGARGGGPSRPRGGRPERRMELRLLVTGLPSTASWQDLKDHMRKAGEVNYAEVFENGRGIVEYQRAEDVNEALRKLNGSKFQSFRNETSYIQVIDDREEVERLSSLPPPGRGRFITRGSPRGNYEPRGARSDRGGYFRGGGVGGRGRGFVRDYGDRGGGGYRDYGYQRDFRDRPPTRFNRDDGYSPRGRGGRPRGDYGRDRDDYYEDRGGRWSPDDRAPRRRLSGDADRSPPSKRARSSSRSPGRTPSPIPVSPRDSTQATSN